MSINPKSDIQDIEVWIKMIKEGKKNKLINILNRLSVPYYLFTGRSNNEWLKALRFKKKQLQEEIKFIQKLNKNK
jgi:hypothetical protein